MKYILLIIMLLILSSYGNNYFNGNDYPDSLYLFEVFENDYINQKRKVIDIEYWFHGKDVVSNFSYDIGGYNLSRYWFEIKINDGTGRIATCKVTAVDNSRYGNGGTWGKVIGFNKSIVEEKKDTVLLKPNVDVDSKVTLKEKKTEDSIGTKIILIFFTLLIGFLLMMAIVYYSREI